MGKRIKARLPYHVIASGYSASDFIAIGRGDVFLQDGIAEGDISWHTTFDLAMQHPAARDGYGAVQKARVLNAIDGQYDVQKSRVHAHKAREASLVIHDGVTDPLRLPFLSADCEARSDGCTLQDVAQIVWDKHLEEVADETARVEARRQV